MYEAPGVEGLPEDEFDADPVSSGIRVCRATIRVDFYPDEGELDFTILAGDGAGGIVLGPIMWAHYDRHHVGIAAADMMAALYNYLKLFPDPFPDTAVTPPRGGVTGASLGDPSDLT
jgi:hypothetical protein